MQGAPNRLILEIDLAVHRKCGIQWKCLVEDGCIYKANTQSCIELYIIQIALDNIKFEFKLHITEPESTCFTNARK